MKFEVEAAASAPVKEGGGAGFLIWSGVGLDITFLETTAILAHAARHPDGKTLKNSRYEAGLSPSAHAAFQEEDQAGHGDTGHRADRAVNTTDLRLHRHRHGLLKRSPDKAWMRRRLYDPGSVP